MASRNWLFESWSCWASERSWVKIRTASHRMVALSVLGGLPGSRAALNSRNLQNQFKETFRNEHSWRDYMAAHLGHPIQKQLMNSRSLETLSQTKEQTNMWGQDNNTIRGQKQKTKTIAPLRFSTEWFDKTRPMTMPYHQIFPNWFSRKRIAFQWLLTNLSFRRSLRIFSRHALLPAPLQASSRSLHNQTSHVHFTTTHILFASKLLEANN